MSITAEPRGCTDGLFVEEAIDRVEQAVQDGQRAGRQRLVVITGKGLHSTQHVAKIKPRVEQLMQQYGLEAHVDPHNAGRLIVNLQPNSGGPRGTRDVHALANQLDTGAGQDQCTIM